MQKTPALGLLSTENVGWCLLLTSNIRQLRSHIAYLLKLVKSDELKTDISRSWHIAWIAMSGILLSVPVILGLHLEQPLRSVTILFKANPTSPMSYGVLILISWIVVASYGLLGIKKGNLNPGRRKTISLISSVLGILFVAYLGFLLEEFRTERLQ